MSNEIHDDANVPVLRKKAEKVLKEKKAKSELPVFKSDKKKLLYELQIHQIELEMQNEELCQAIETAETALKKYTMLYDLAPMGYVTIDRDGTICELNFTAAEMLGERRFRLVNNNFKLFIHNDSLPVFTQFSDKVFDGKFKESCKVKLGQGSNHLYHVFMEGIVTGEDQKCLLSVVDIERFSK